MDGITRNSFSGFAKARRGKWAERGHARSFLLNRTPVNGRALGRGTQISERRRCNVQVSSLFSRYLFLNIFPFALNVYPCSSLHFSNSLGLFFSCSNADATASAPGMSESAATEKHVDSPRREIRRTNLESTRK